MDIFSKRHPGDEDVGGAVSGVADELQISEFELFKTAYCAWHGRVVNDAGIEPLFMDYMFRERVPPWVRDFVRKAAGHRAGQMGIPPECRPDQRPPDAAMRSRGWGYLALLSIFLVWFCIMLVYGFPSY